MNLAQLLTVDQIVPEMKSTEHLAAIEELVNHLDAKHLIPGLDKEQVLDQLRRREEQVSTGIGSGVAIPHTFVRELKEVVTVFGRSRQGIEFGALDNAPVFFVVLFVVPKAEYHLHLKTLAAIAKLFSSSEVRQCLAAAEGGEEILQILAKRPARA
jgi:mannitol/fructose-specific phosphotransferase system IIA component (Ntr-type)